MENTDVKKTSTSDVAQTQQPAQTDVTPVSNKTDPYYNYALASLVLGVLSVLSSLIVYPGLAFGIMSIIFGLRGKESIYKPILAKAGIIIGVLGILSSIFWGVMSLYLTILPEL